MLQQLKDHKVATDVTKIVIHYLDLSAVDISDIKSKTGKDRAFYTAENGKVSIRSELKLWDYAVEKTNDPHVGLQMSRLVDLESLGVVGYLSLQQPDLLHLIQTYAYYHGLLHELAQLKAYSLGQQEIIEHGFQNPGEGPGQAASEITIGGIWQVLQKAAVSAIELQEVHFQHRPPNSMVVYLDYFKGTTEFKFNQDYNRLVFSAGTFSVKTRSPDYQLAKILQGYADQALKDLPGTSAIENEVFPVISSLLPEAKSSLDNVAAKLSIHPRTLQRRLKEKGYVFRDLVESVRKSLALKYLEKTELNFTEIGYLCGFSEPAAFSRAFKRWTGKSPTKYRLLIS